MDWYYILLIAIGCIGVGVGGTFAGKEIVHRIWESNHTASPKYARRIAEYQMLNLETEQEGAPVLFLGDSITDNFPLHEFFPGKHYVNRGIGGDRADWLPKRLADNVYGIKPKKIFLLIGVNDLNHDYGVDITFNNIKKVINLLKENLPCTEVILSAIYPVNPNLVPNKRARAEMTARNLPAQLEKLNVDLGAYAKKAGLRFNRTADALKDGDGLLSKKYTDDGVHPNFAGYRVIAKYMQEKFKL